MYRFLAFLNTLLLALSVNAVEVGKNAPNFKLPSLQNMAPNEDFHLADHQGNVVYVDFWASWCGPCKRSFPALNHLHNKYKDKGFTVVAINLDENIKDAKNFLEKIPVNFPIVHDQAGTTPTSYNLKGMPTAYLLDQEGKVHYVIVGFNENEEKVVESKIQALLGKP